MRLGQLLRRIERDFLLGPPTSPPRERAETVMPGERSPLSRQRRALAYALAVVLPTAAALAMLPLRADHAQVVALILVVPVVAVAVLGAVGPAVVAALVAGVVYDVAHTEPYWRLVIDDPDDIATTVTLGAVAVAVGLLCSRVVHLRARDAARHDELRHLIVFARSAASTADVDALAQDACRHLTSLLNLRECRWQPGYHGDVGPVLLPTGAVMGYVTALNRDRAKLPDSLEIPAVVGTRELGRFVLTPDHRTIVSAEERLTASTIVALFANAAGPRS